MGRQREFPSVAARRNDSTVVAGGFNQVAILNHRIRIALCLAEWVEYGRVTNRKKAIAGAVVQLKGTIPTVKTDRQITTRMSAIPL